MSGCLGCSCERAEASLPGGRVLLATRVSHTRQALSSALRGHGAVSELLPGLLEVRTEDPVGAVAAARRGLSSVEANEVRALFVEGQSGDEMIAAALTAPSLARVSARSEHADLLPLFDDEEGAFRSVYQPIVALADGPGAATGSAQQARIVGYEALLRATSSSGQIMPDQLFSAAKQAGWLHVLDRIGRTCALHGAGGWLGEEMLFVNFLPTTIYRPEVCLATTERAARRAGIDLRQVVFEVTESERVTDLDHLAEVFAYYRRQGCKVALDDLGSGYSSLNVLVRLQPDIVKLDKEIVQRLPDPASCAVVAAVVKITDAYGGTVLAECIETREQALAARDLGVALGQGWYFGRPMERDVAMAGRVGGQVGGPPTASVPSRPRVVARAIDTLNATGDDPAVSLPVPTDIAASQGDGVRPSSARLDTLLARAVQASNVSISIADALDPERPLIYVNEAFEELTGYSGREILGSNCRFLQEPGMNVDALRDLREALRDGREHLTVLRNRRKDGTLWWNELRISPIHDADGRLTHFFGFQNDVTDRVETQEQIRHLATHDQLTGLPNREQILISLSAAIDRAAADGTQTAVLFVDLDNFKMVNDSLGHGAGDLALIATAARLRSALREGDLVGRNSGDEFIVVLPGVPTHLADAIARRTADSLSDSFDGPIDLDVGTVTLSASIGFALFPEHGATAESLIDAADQAMYSAKTQGRGGVSQAPRATSASRADPTAHAGGRPES